MNEQAMVFKDFLSCLEETQDRVKNAQKKLRREAGGGNVQQPTEELKHHCEKTPATFPSSSTKNKENINRNTFDTRHDEKEIAVLKHQVSTMQTEIIMLRNKGRQRIQHDNQVESLKQQLVQVRHELQIANDSSREILRRYGTEMTSIQHQLQIAIEANVELGKQAAAIKHEKEVQQASLTDVNNSMVLLQYETEEYKMQYNELTDILRDLTW